MQKQTAPQILGTLLIRSLPVLFFALCVGGPAIEKLQGNTLLIAAMSILAFIGLANFMPTVGQLKEHVAKMARSGPGKLAVIGTKVASHLLRATAVGGIVLLFLVKASDGISTEEIHSAFSGRADLGMWTVFAGLIMASLCWLISEKPGIIDYAEKQNGLGILDRVPPLIILGSANLIVFTLLADAGASIHCFA
jgi:hypothetical protein